MARRRRPIIETGAVYHVISRFVAREWFICTEEERRGYLQVLGRGLAESDWRCFAYAIMSNHIHLGLVAGTETLASWIRPGHSQFADWINQRRERIGAVFVRGPNVRPVHRDGVARLISYIHCNPVRAGLVVDPRDSDWTSHQAYLGLSHRPSWLHIDLGIELAGFADAAELDAWTAGEDLQPTTTSESCV